MQAKAKSSLKPNDLIVLIALLVVAGVTYFAATKLAPQVKEKSSLLSTKQAELTRLSQEYQQLKQLAVELPKYKDDIDLLNVAFPKDEQVIEGLIQSQAMAESAGVAVDSLTPGKGAAGSLPMTLTVKGKYEAINKLLDLFLTNLRPVSVKTYSLTSGAGDDKSVVLGTVNFGLAYRGAPGADAASTVSQPPAQTPAQ